MFDNDVKPTRSKSDFVIKTTERTILIYDMRENRSFSLNEIMLMVWQLCDGKTDLFEIKKQLNKKFTASLGEEVVWLALTELKTLGFVENCDNRAPTARV